MKTRIGNAILLLAALAGVPACAQTATSAADSNSNAPVASIASIYVTPGKRAQFEALYEQRYAGALGRADGLLESYLLAPLADDNAAPFKHFTIWRDRASYDKFFAKVTSGEHPAGAKSSYGGEGDLYTRRPIYELYAVPVHRNAASTATAAGATN
ncbi:antibiotic biosynthesis monooxygenase family protein [Burkholderia thailandensis MSMB121]|uniref:antibiotic biosynthesis monooxygenase family protein n=1 Tax=Burkholderia humptydooensis TaxID=430531 RepID=UPI000327F167|nr:antibiotic biosynthesis monooxygenase family protein [Burkholderia humptydooensis]AGK51694.1 antibiotic biosynthesis monooxygenase family protein [Burkholderia thailandensis MSMB121]ATF33247.1 antibiotic biosynthesis monooxygenase [Burkholderia thailandensis]KST71332.1 antibiotic biosynthesis monooxygenase [Burkholderia humptydooensis]